MQVQSLLIVLILSPLTLFLQALPLISQALASQPALRRRVAYSIVAVDGGPAATLSSTNMPVAKTIVQTSDRTETVTAPVATLPPSTETIISTAAITTTEPANTVGVGVTRSPAPMAYQVVNADQSPPSPTTSYITEASTASKSVNYISSTSSFTSTSALKTSTTLVIFSTAIPSAKPAAATTAPAEAGWLAPSGLLPPSSIITTHITQPTTTSKTYDNGMWHTTWRVWNTTSTTPTSSIATTFITSRVYDAWEQRMR